MATLKEKVAELVELGYEPAEARELASMELRKEMQAAGKAIAGDDEPGTARTSQGVPATYQRTAKGLKVPMTTERIAVLVPGGPGKGSTHYGPGMELHFRQYATRDSAMPNALWVPGASSSSYHRNVDETAVVQFARAMVEDTGTRLFVQDHKAKTEKDENGIERLVIPDAVEFTDRAAWLEAVRDRVGDFLEDCSAAAQSVGIKVRAR